jgi:hypothetical protein
MHVHPNSHLTPSPIALFCSKIDWSAFHKACSQHLPVYARPAFIRIVKVSVSV